MGLDLDRFHKMAACGTMPKTEPQPPYLKLFTGGTTMVSHRPYYYHKDNFLQIELYFIERMIFFNGLKGRRLVFLKPRTSLSSPNILTGPHEETQLKGYEIWYLHYDERSDAAFWHYWLTKIEDLRPTYLYTRPSELQAICPQLVRTFDYPIVSTCETLYPEYKTHALRYFPRIIDKMRCWDGGLSFFECLHGRKHINDELSIVSEYDQQITSTDLFNYAQPFLKYQNGDQGTIAKGQCACGLYGSYFGTFAGREIECLISQSGKHWPGGVVISAVMAGIDQHHLKLEIPLRYQIIQNKDKNIDLMFNQRIPQEAHAEIGSILYHILNDDNKPPLAITTKIEPNIGYGQRKLILIRSHAITPNPVLLNDNKHVDQKNLQFEKRSD